MRASSPLINYFHLFFSVLADGLSENFEEVSVSVVDCPDLTENPSCWHQEVCRYFDVRF